MIIKMKSIIQTLDDTNILDIKKYNDRITGPFQQEVIKHFKIYVMWNILEKQILFINIKICY